MEIFDKIKSKIRHIQSRPENIKVKILWVSVVSIFALIVGLWLGFSEDFKISAYGGSAGGGKNLRQSYPLNGSFGKIIKEFKSNIENKIKQAQVWKSEK